MAMTVKEIIEALNKLDIPADTKITYLQIPQEGNSITALISFGNEDNKLKYGWNHE